MEIQTNGATKETPRDGQGVEVTGARKQRRRLHPALVVVIDILLIGISLCVYALFDHVLPQRLSSDLSKTGRTTVTRVVSQAGTATSTVASSSQSGTSTTRSTAADAQAETLTFAGDFSDGAAVSTESSYVGTNASVTLNRVQSNGVTYYVEDIYVRSIEALRSAFAGDTYGKAVTESVLSMAKNNTAIAAINGDYYGIGSKGVVIRNGILYSPTVDGDICVLFLDGTMKVYAEGEFDADEVAAAGAWQAWDFGPSLLTDGAAITDFSSSRISGVNPRTAIGYFEPGHYCFVVVDGRQDGYSDGMSLAELSALMENLGCSVAYNLDGGKSSNMTFQGSLANQPTEGGREVTDIIYVTDTDGE